MFKRTFAALGAILVVLPVLAGCTPGASESKTEVAQRLAALEDKSREFEDKFSRKGVSPELRKLQADVAGLKSDVHSITRQMAELSDRVNQLVKKVYPEAGTSTTDGGDNGWLTGRDPIAEVDQLIQDYIKNEKLGKDLWAPKVAAYADAAVQPCLFGLDYKLGRRRNEICEATLAILGKRDFMTVKGALIEAIENDPVRRIRVLSLLAEIGNTSVSQFVLDEMAKETDDQLYKLSAAGAAARLKRVEGIEALLQFLKSPTLDLRALAFGALNDITGYDFGYVAISSPEDNAQSIKKWEEWFAANKDTLFK